MPTLLRYSLLAPRERMRALRAAGALRRLDPAEAALDARTFGEWLRAHGQSNTAIAELWNLITLPTLNLPADEGSLALATMVFRTGLLDAADACDVGVPAVPLQRLHGDAATAAEKNQFKSAGSESGAERGGAKNGRAVRKPVKSINLRRSRKDG